MNDSALTQEEIDALLGKRDINFPTYGEECLRPMLPRLRRLTCYWKRGYQNMSNIEICIIGATGHVNYVTDGIKEDPSANVLASFDSVSVRSSVSASSEVAARFM